MELFDLGLLSKLPLEEQIKIKKMTINTNELSAIPVAYLPEVSSTEYFFISYSHKDYKDVYNDIFDLQQAGLEIWYDRGIPAGKNWKETASKYIAPFSCKGTIFYLSENALISDSVMMEIRSALSYNKPFLAILLSKKKETLQEMIERLYIEKRIDEQKRAFYLDIFKEEIIYLSIDEPSLTKVEKIKNALPKQKTLSIEKLELVSGSEKTNRPNGFEMEILGLNDFYVNRIELSDYLDLLDFKYLVSIGAYDKNQETTKTMNLDFDNPEKSLSEMSCFLVDIGTAAFANIETLEYFEYPCLGSGLHFVEISPYAFYRCGRLKEFKIIRGEAKTNPIRLIGKGAFSRCISLERFDFDNAAFDEESFSLCASLEEADLSNAYCSRSGLGVFAPRRAFYFRRDLKKLVLPEGLAEIGDSAFEFCGGIDSIVFPPHLKKIGESAFSCCKSLREIYLGGEIEEIGEKAFVGCGDLKRIHFAGTKEQLAKAAGSISFISFSGNVDYYEGAVEVIFEDGTSISVKELFAEEK